MVSERQVNYWLDRLEVPNANRTPLVVESLRPAIEELQGTTQELGRYHCFLVGVKVRFFRRFPKFASRALKRHEDEVQRVTK